MSEDKGHHSGMQHDRAGEALAAVLRSAPPEGPCLAPEEIDLLVEVRAREEVRKRLMAHLASCDSCLRSFGVAAELAREERLLARRRWRIRVPLALAALLLVALSLRLVRESAAPRLAMKELAPPVVQQVPPSGSVPMQATPPAQATAPAAAVTPGQPAAPQPGEPASAKAKAAPAGGFAPALAVLAKLPQPRAGQAEMRSFAGSAAESRARARFLAGGELLEARLSLARGEREPAAELLRQAATHLQPGAGAPGDELARLVTDLKSAEQNILARRIEQLFTPVTPSVDPHVALGAWSKAVLVAASANDPALFATGWFTATGNALVSGPFSSDTAGLIRQILAVAAEGDSPMKFSRLKALARNLAEVTR
ncbi:hypothetical protein M1B72_10940 [Geomonas paludis]|uniref:Zinc-finger domain-containing protein n=1 Tax=Geomonas paludis TaxID=2740185 RepID=A0A6V8MT58_9BACT|nr:hypothetical protein [Geomonas paludis]UPU38198.1 hypothetical protein M1B72_10940 [Geomonas paludis]GFO63270.1 hypothetical protein GMPD_11890 [Geomonas paludis]